MIIRDNTVLSSFAHIDKLNILPRLFGEVIIPESVYSEGVLTAKKSERVERIKRSVAERRIKVLKPTERDTDVAKRLPKTLGFGERYTIALGISKRCLIATDYFKAKKSSQRARVRHNWYYWDSETGP